MSAEDTRFNRSKRRANKYVNIAKQIKVCSVYGINVTNPNKYGKLKALNCGDPNCAMCGNPRKFFNEKTIQEKRFEEIKIEQELC